MSTSIETAFKIYRDRFLYSRIKPRVLEDQRLAFYTGFQMAMAMIDQLAEISEKDPERASEIMDQLNAEYERFASEQVGIKTH